MRKTKCIITGKVQNTQFILCFCIFFITLFSYTSFAQQKVQQMSSGKQSPNIYAPGGIVSINYSISQKSYNELLDLLKGKGKEIDRLLKTLDEKDVKIEEREAIIQDWIKKYKELEQRLAQRPSEDNLSTQARERLTSGDLEGAEKLLQQSMEKNLQDINRKTKAAAADAYEIGSIKELQLNYQSAREYFYQALQLAPDNSGYLNRYGLILFILGDYKKAVDYFEKALKINITIYGDKYPNVAVTYNKLGLAWVQLGDHKKAVDYFEKALKILLAVYGDKHSNVALTYICLGSAWDQLGDYKKAVDYFEKALKINITIYGDKHPNVALNYNSLSLAWGHLGESQKAVDYLERALKILLAVYGDKHPYIAINYNNLGSAWDQLGDHKKAVDYFEKASKILLAVYGDRHPIVAINYNDLGSAWDQLGDHKKAVDYFEKALKINITVYGDKHPNVAVNYSNLGSAWDQLGDHKKAVDYFEKARKINIIVYGVDHAFTKLIKIKIDALNEKK